MAAASRSASRRRAVELVFESFQRGRSLKKLVAERTHLLAALGADLADEAADTASDEDPLDGPALPPYTLRLIEGVVEHRELISEWLDTYTQGWPQHRMPGVDRAILYVGAYEVVFEDDVPDSIAIKAAADLAGKLSTDKSAGFVSGLLGRLSKIKSTLI
ncbi:MAG: transcription antitermination protein NusB [Bifidobacteriaceae bacterium]|nr:transcription antitermination protein NusB [Bifidobacteriaceae bacterium]